MNDEAMRHRRSADTEEPDAADLAAAAEELAGRLKGLADTLAATGRPKKISYGRGFIKHRSPAGFVVDAPNRQMLLPDGRLWSYTGGDVGQPAGRYLDVAADYQKYVHSRISLRGTTFAFLGATLGRYTFGFAGGTLSAIVGEGTSLRVVDGAEAFAALAEQLGKRG